MSRSDSESWASIEEVAAHLGVRKDSVYRWIERRGLPATKVGKLWKLKLSEVDAWMLAQRTANGAGDASAPGRTAARATGARGACGRDSLWSVLVVDDDELVRDSVSDFLIDEGYDVAVASDGEEAIRWLGSAARLPALIILDLEMPRLDGWQFREAQLADPRLASIPVIVVTALEAKISGAVLLKKPLRLAALTRAMAGLAVPGANEVTR